MTAVVFPTQGVLFMDAKKPAAIAFVLIAGTGMTLTASAEVAERLQASEAATSLEVFRKAVADGELILSGWQQNADGSAEKLADFSDAFKDTFKDTNVPT
jgi:nucleoid-associated protein YgaU